MRNLLKRQIRSTFEHHQARLAEGLWLVRVRQPFAAAEFASASSSRLRAAVRGELLALLEVSERGREPARTQRRGGSEAAAGTSHPD